jgi:stalled ribosome rescue protein Dom34
MSTHNKKQFGIWMDAHQATIVGRDATAPNTFVVMGHVNNAGTAGNSNEHAANQQESTQRHSYFKDIAATMVNVDEVHITGTGQAQEQFMKFLAETPQYKNAVTSESTSNKMGDEQLVAFVSERFN